MVLCFTKLSVLGIIPAASVVLEPRARRGILAGTFAWFQAESWPSRLRAIARSVDGKEETHGLARDL